MKLFLKIFIWFWLTMILIGAALIISVATIGESTPGPPWMDFVSSALRLHAQEAAKAFEKGGVTSLEAYLENIEDDYPFKTYFYNEQGDEVRGRKSPEGASS